MDQCKTPIRNNVKKDSFTIPPSPFLKRLGYGSGVVVYKFERSPKRNILQSPWALKMTGSRHKNSVYSKRLRTEAEFLRKMDHTHIISFRAFTKTPDGKECLAMEVCTISLGDLIERRLEDGLLAFEPNKIMTMCLHISKALDYIHKEMLMLHGDIKSHNVLIKGDFDICKLCDFGVCLPLKPNGHLDVDKIEQHVGYIGTLVWSAPEVIKDNRDVTNKSDIFSYGLVTWEMISLNIPHSDNLNDSLDSSMTEELYGTRPAVPFEMLGNNPNDYNNPLQIYYCCTEENPNLRPSADKLSVEIDEMLQSVLK